MSTAHLLAGLNGAGKTTYARTLPAVRFSLDEWMLRLHADVRFDEPVYPLLAVDCQRLIWDVARQVLDAGADVVLDWNQWSRARRASWRVTVEDAGHAVVLHHLTAGLDVAVARALARRDPVSHDLADRDVRHLAGLFEPPSDDEGLVIREVSP